MSQNRNAPAYQEYAATILAQLPFRTMTLQDRGLFYTMRLECWVNVRLPNNQDDLAKVLGLPIAEVTTSIAAVMPFFKVVDGFIFSPELEDYRTHLAERKLKQSQGGKRGSAITNSKRNNAAKTIDDNDSSIASSKSQLPLQGRSKSSVQPNTLKPSQNQPLKKEVIDDPFVKDYEAAEQCTASDYAKASGGY